MVWCVVDMLEEGTFVRFTFPKGYFSLLPRGGGGRRAIAICNVMDIMYVDGTRNESERAYHPAYYQPTTSLPPACQPAQVRAQLKVLLGLGNWVQTSRSAGALGGQVSRRVHNVYQLSTQCIV